MSYNYRGITNNPTERQRSIPQYCYWENAFSDEEIESICKLMSSVMTEEASVGGKDQTGNTTVPVPTSNPSARKSRVCFHKPNENNSFIFERFNYIIDMMNARWYNFDINGYDLFQYTEYDSKDQGHYTWHIDLFVGDLPRDNYFETRKLSVTFLLNEPGKDFEGGEFQFGLESSHETVPMKKGSLIMFPSFFLHRITPVTKGIRKSIVIWIEGPKFR